MEYTSLMDLFSIDWTEAVVVFKQESFDKPYTEKERSYKIRKDCKYFHGGYISNALWGDCLDGVDVGVRLDYYLSDWDIEKIYIVK